MAKKMSGEAKWRVIAEAQMHEAGDQYLLKPVLKNRISQQPVKPAEILQPAQR